MAGEANLRGLKHASFLDLVTFGWVRGLIQAANTKDPRTKQYNHFSEAALDNWVPDREKTEVTFPVFDRMYQKLKVRAKKEGCGRGRGGQGAFVACTCGLAKYDDVADAARRRQGDPCC